MLATLVIGLREGLEAALIVGIVAAFLRKNGKSLVPMWLGVGAAVVISFAVGIVLKLVERALPQAAQEGMETIIGAVAIVFVTSMVLWMRTNARTLKKELEGSAGAALGEGTAWALVAMTFLAVLKEGFESAVFLLATLSVAQSSALAAVGALIGFAIAIAIGYGLYRGGIKINLGRFFSITSAFLILVAAGLVLQALRTAHEAGWLVAGQQRVLDLSVLVRPGSVQAALITGVLGIPADPRAIEVLGWALYLVPMALVLFWPKRLRPGAVGTARLRYGLAGLLAATAVVLAIATPWPSGNVPASATINLAAGGTGQVTLTGTTDAPALHVEAAGSSADLALNAAGPDQHGKVVATRYEAASSDTPELPTTLTLDELLTLNGGRLPVGISAVTDPGPFDAAWAVRTSTDVWLADGRLLDATQQSVTTLTLTGGGLTSSRTITVAADATLPGTAHVPAGWVVDPAHVAAATTIVNGLSVRRQAALFWKLVVPLGAVVAAGLLVGSVVRARTVARRRDAASTNQSEAAASTRPIRTSVHVS